MSDAATCKTCPYVEKGSLYRARCHYNAPVASNDEDGAAFWPHIDPEADWCGEHPDRQPHLECATATLVGRETFPTESDMRRIIDALEKMASRTQRATP